MRRMGGVLVGMLLAGGAWAVNAAAAPADQVDLAPAATSVDHAPFCDLPDAPPVASTSGGTAVTFTLLPPGC